jgi:hypothetical protein
MTQTLHKKATRRTRGNPQAELLEQVNRYPANVPCTCKGYLGILESSPSRTPAQKLETRDAAYRFLIGGVFVTVPDGS